MLGDMKKSTVMYQVDLDFVGHLACDNGELQRRFKCGYVCRVLNRNCFVIEADMEAGMTVWCCYFICGLLRQIPPYGLLSINLFIPSSTYRLVSEFEL